MRKILLIVIILGITSSSVMARDEYDKTFDSIYTAQKIYYSLDAKLNKVYKNLKNELSKSGRKVLARSEAKWVVERDHKCAYPRTHSVNIDCAVYETRARLHFLEDRVRECEEIGCKINRL